MALTLTWLFIWVVYGTPVVNFNPMNNWAIALVVMVGVDIITKVGVRDET